MPRKKLSCSNGRVAKLKSLLDAYTKCLKKLLYHFVKNK